MNVSCPNCNTTYRVDPAKVPEAGVRARCAVCSAVFSVRRDAAAPAGPAARQLSKEVRPLVCDAVASEQLLDVRCGHRVEEDAPAARDHRRQHDERIEARGREHDHSVRMRLLERLEQHALVLVAQPADVRDHRHAPRADRGLQVQERLQ